MHDGPVAGFRRLDRGAALDNLPGGFEPGHERQRRFVLIAAGHHENVRKIDRGRAQADPNLVWLKIRIRQILQPQQRRRPKLAADYCFHGTAQPGRRTSLCFERMTPGI